MTTHFNASHFTLLPYILHLTSYILHRYLTPDISHLTLLPPTPTHLTSNCSSTSQHISPHIISSHPNNSHLTLKHISPHIVIPYPNTPPRVTSHLTPHTHLRIAFRSKADDDVECRRTQRYHMRLPHVCSQYGIETSSDHQQYGCGSQDTGYKQKELVGHERRRDIVVTTRGYLLCGSIGVVGYIYHFVTRLRVGVNITRRL